MTVDDAHAIVRNALQGADDEAPGLHDLRLADLNKTERKQALKALDALHDLDYELAERSGFESLEKPFTENAGGDE